MFCTQCGVELEPQDRYCCQCGKGTGVGSPFPARQPARRLTLSTHDKKIAGVCAGFAHYFDVDVTLMRIIWLVLVFVPPGVGLIGYLLAWLIMPKDESRAVTSSEPSAVTR
jgi:phage shock protein C